MDLLAVALPALSEAWGLILSQLSCLSVSWRDHGSGDQVFPGLGGIAGLVTGITLYVWAGTGVRPCPDDRHGRGCTDFRYVCIGADGYSGIIGLAGNRSCFPMAKKGMAARALSAAFASSLFGGLIGAFFLTFFILVARPVVLEFKSPELLMVSAFGLSMVGILAGRVALKGLMAAGVGIGRIHWRRAVQWRITHGSYDFPI